MPRHALAPPIARFHVRGLDGWTFRLTTGPSETELQGIFGSHQGGTLRATVTGLSSRPDGGRIELRVTHGHALSVEMVEMRDVDEALAAVRDLVAALADGELTAVPHPPQLAALPSRPRLRGC